MVLWFHEGLGFRVMGLRNHFYFELIVLFTIHVAPITRPLLAHRCRATRFKGLGFRV